MTREQLLALDVAQGEAERAARVLLLWLLLAGGRWHRNQAFLEEVAPIRVAALLVSLGACAKQQSQNLPAAGCPQPTRLALASQTGIQHPPSAIHVGEPRRFPVAEL